MPVCVCAVRTYVRTLIETMLCLSGQSQFNDTVFAFSDLYCTICKGMHTYVSKYIMYVYVCIYGHNIICSISFAFLELPTKVILFMQTHLYFYYFSH